MKGEIQRTLTQKLNDSVVAEISCLTNWEIPLTQVSGAAVGVIGMRRSGKTCFISASLASMLMTASHRTALGCMEFTKHWVNRVDATAFRSLSACSRPAGPLFSSRRMTHTSAGIFLPRRNHKTRKEAA